jgi:membrane protease YdiL (CAAX protease family)
LFSLPLAYILTLIVNAVRIRFALVAQFVGDLWLGERPHHKIHETAGIFVNLIFLIIILIGVEYALKKRSQHEITAPPGLDTGV